MHIDDTLRIATTKTDRIAATEGLAETVVVDDEKHLQWSREPHRCTLFSQSMPKSSIDERRERRRWIAPARIVLALPHDTTRDLLALVKRMVAQPSNRRLTRSQSKAKNAKLTCCCFGAKIDEGLAISHHDARFAPNA
ncbi:hypothetical protein [Rhizobium mongolense]|nr:hypothetical protein [Rhizobium mongolense]MBB4233003.1 hypothetical protein [Rhizobium mongolense]